VTDAQALPDLREFSRIVFFTGAGLSAESGIPTYRGAGGVWRKYNYEDYACQRAFDRQPAQVWEFHDARRADVAACEPNAAHRIIAEVQAAKPGTAVITQNIDGLHQRAGAAEVLELHGSLWRVRCDRCGARRENHDLPLEPKQCPCGSLWRPDVVWFEDMLEYAVIQAAVERIGGCDCLISVGTSGQVYPAAELPFLAMRAGAVSVEVNPEATPLSSHFNHCLRGPATAMLHRLWPGEDG